MLGQLHTYSDPQRDPRQHNITTVFVARADGTPQAADDARSLAIFPPRRACLGTWPLTMARYWRTISRFGPSGWPNLRRLLRFDLVIAHYYWHIEA